ncbi:MAG: cobalamin-dependent protein [Pseudomonadota bacterium]
MAAPQAIGTQTKGLRLKLSTAALRKAIAKPLHWRKPSEPNSGTTFNTCASQDPVCTALERDIIPRLMMAHIVDGSFRPIEERIEIEPGDTQSFAALPLRLEAPSLLEQVDRFLESGMSVEDVYLDLLAPAARHLGELWSADECDFVDVTMGLWRLQEVMREITRRSPPQAGHPDTARTALFCPIPGDVHSFGAQMIEEVFARAGWRSEVLLQPDRRELLDYVSSKSVDLVGLTISRDGPVSALASLVKGIRSVSMNPNLHVLVGGHMINQNPALVSEIGADGTAPDARSALEFAERLIPAAPTTAPSMI